MTAGQRLQVSVRANLRQQSGDAELDFDLWTLEREAWWADGDDVDGWWNNLDG
jgi:hypothetical protein